MKNYDREERVPNEETVEYLFNATREWPTPPSKEEIREDLKDQRNDIKYMYPHMVSRLNLRKQD